MTVQTSTGIVVSLVEGAPATYDQAGFEALSYTQLGEVTNIPEYGASAAVVEHNPLETGITEKFKGFTNYGSTSFELGRDGSDAGQALVAAATDPTDASFNSIFSVEVAFSDGSKQYFTAKPFSYTTNPGAANSIVAATVQVEIINKVLEIAAP